MHHHQRSLDRIDHLPDVTMAAPIFHKGKLVGFSGSIAHLPDIGGGGWSSDGRELFEEGIRITPMKFLKEGEPNQDVIRFHYGQCPCAARSSATSTLK